MKRIDTLLFLFVFLTATNLSFAKDNTPNIGHTKTKVATDENAITDCKGSNDGELVVAFETLTPTTYLLWYTGFIDDYPITLKLKRTFNENAWGVRISEVAYAYDSKKEWINLEDLSEFQSNFFSGKAEQDGIYGVEYSDGHQTGSWEVPFEINKTLTGLWYDATGETFAVKLIPMVKKSPDFHIMVYFNSDLSTERAIANEDGGVLEIFEKDEVIQTLYFDWCSSAYFYETAYVDVNYDGYLDLVVDHTIFLYNYKTNQFDESIVKDEVHGVSLTSLDEYNPYTKSVSLHEGKTRIEYRAVNGVLTPYESHSIWLNEGNNFVITTKRYNNGNWKIIKEEIEEMEETGDSYYESFELDAGLNVYQDVIYFTPNLKSYPGNDGGYKAAAKLFVDITYLNGLKERHYLHDVSLNGTTEDMLNDNSILFNGTEYILDNWNGPIPFFPPNLNLNKKQYHFRLTLTHPLIGEVSSDERTLNLPFSIKKAKNTLQLEGTINNKVNGKIYFVWNDTEVKATFVNNETKQRIRLKGTVIGEKVNLTEYEKDDEISGYFEGTFINTIYSGQWISPNKKIKVPFVFK